MKQIVATLLSAMLLAACQSPFPNTPPKNYGAVVRTTLASQVIAPQPHPDSGTDGAAGAAAYANYQRSYVSPVPQDSSPSFGRK